MEPTTTDAAASLKDVLPAASDFVYTLFKDRLPETILFHGYQHTVDVVEAAQKIARKSDVEKRERTLLHLAALFHDTGFTETYENHEEASARIAASFLAEQGLPEEDIEQIQALILATREGHVPQTFLEEILRDADIAHLGRKKFFERAERLRAEWEYHREKSLTDEEWTELQLNFLMSASYATPYARKKYDKRKRKNVKEMRRKLAEMLDETKPLPPVEEDKGVPKRGIETMFRSAYRTHINLSSIADAKANIMISINAILMSIIVSFISTRAQHDPWLLIPSGILLIFCLIAIIFAILSARPKVTNEVFTLEDIRKNEANILFFGNFVNLPLDTFKLGIREIMKDWDRLYDSMSSDLHSLGKVLQKKYQLLWISYTVFMAGLVVSVAVLALLFLFL